MYNKKCNSLIIYYFIQIIFAKFHLVLNVGRNPIVMSFIYIVVSYLAYEEQKQMLNCYQK